MKNHLLLLLSSISILMISCEDFFLKEVDNANLPIVESVPVFQAVCGEDSTYFIALAKSKPMFGPVQNENGNPYIMNEAEVTITNKGQSVSLIQTTDETIIKKQNFATWDPSYNSYGFYINNAYRFVAGETYTLTVKKDGKTATSTFTIPASKPLNVSAKMETTYYDPEDKKTTDQSRILVKLDWTAADPEDYYFLKFYNYSYYVNFGDTVEYKQETSVYSNQTGYYESETYYNCITPVDGNNGQFSKSFYYSNSTTGETSEKALVIIYTVKKEFYEFYKTALANVHSSGDPFAEPVKVFTNVEGGFGIATGYNKTIIKQGP